jgi:hypothetical protein
MVNNNDFFICVKDGFGNITNENRKIKREGEKYSSKT